MCYNPFTSRSAESQGKKNTTTKTIKQKKQKQKMKQLHSVKIYKNILNNAQQSVFNTWR